MPNLHSTGSWLGPLAQLRKRYFFENHRACKIKLSVVWCIEPGDWVPVRVPHSRCPPKHMGHICIACVSVDCSTAASSAWDVAGTIFGRWDRVLHEKPSLSFSRFVGQHVQTVQTYHLLSCAKLSICKKWTHLSSCASDVFVQPRKWSVCTTAQMTGSCAKPVT